MSPVPPLLPARYTAVLSDLHLSDAEPADPRRPGWRAFKRAGLDNDARLTAALDHLRVLSGGEPIDLVLDGDALDFDTILARPDPAPFPVTWLERQRGLDSEEAKSLWKLGRILEFHPVFVASLRRWVAEGNGLTFIIGNHDLDLHWPSVQAALAAALGDEAKSDGSFLLHGSAPAPGRVTVCAFFQVCGGDTLVIHCNQLDAYCVCQDPLHPFIEVGGRTRVRSPFGNLAGKLMLNGMGYFNPHVESSFIRSLSAYLAFFFRYIMRYQPLLVYTWFWSAVVTLTVSLEEGFRPAVRDPETLASRLETLAERSHASPAVALALREVTVHSAVFSPLRVFRELWLDRAFGFFAVVGLAFYAMLALHWVSGAHTWTALVFFAVFLLPFIAYARSCRSSVGGTEHELQQRVALLARIAGVRHLVVGHTHRAAAREIDGVTYLNTGHRSPAFDDVECQEPVGRSAFAWVHPGPDGARVAELRVWTGETSVPEAGEPVAPVAAR